LRLDCSLSQIREQSTLGGVLAVIMGSEYGHTSVCPHAIKAFQANTGKSTCHGRA